MNDISKTIEAMAEERPDRAAIARSAGWEVSLNGEMVFRNGRWMGMGAWNPWISDADALMALDEIVLPQKPRMTFDLYFNGRIWMASINVWEGNCLADANIFYAEGATRAEAICRAILALAA